jgi:hypothetical protein
MVIDFNPDGKKTLLSIDGGGARGFIALMMLKKLEADTGKTGFELFDFVSGTSVGAVIAAAIAYRMSADEIIEIFERFAGDVFHLNYLEFVFKHGFRYLYDKTKLRDLLAHYFGSTTLGQLEQTILLTAKDMGRSETIFLVNRGPGAPATRDVTVAQAVEASASAPVYFEPVGDAVDGGVGTYGNTCYVATVEALEYLSKEDPDWRDDHVIHLSFGTGLPSNSVPRGKARTWLPFHWPLWIISEGLDEASENNVQFTQRHYGQRIDFRRYNVSLLDDVIKNELGLTIPSGMRSNDLGLDSSSVEQIALMKAIGQAFAAGVDFALTGEQLRQNPPPGYGGAYYPSRLPPLSFDEIQRVLTGR